MLMSVDGKISTGDTDALDFDKDLPNILGVREGLAQYYDLEKQTDLYSLNTGRVMEKIGVNEKTDEPPQLPVSFIIIDNKPHLNASGVKYLAKKVKTLFLVTSSPNHPAHELHLENVVILFEPDGIQLDTLFQTLKQEHGVDALTIQSGGTLNAALFRAGLIDHISIVVAPLIVGGSTTPTIVDGEANHSLEDLKNLVALKLVNATPLNDSYLHLRYDVQL